MNEEINVEKKDTGTVEPVPEHTGADANSPEQSGTVRKDTHTLSVKEVQQLLYTKDVSVSVRAITNYCKLKDGASLLDCFYDYNDRRWYITPDSVEKATEEIRSRKERMIVQLGGKGEKALEALQNEEKDSEDASLVKKLTEENEDLKFDNRVQKELVKAARRREGELIEAIRADSLKIGELQQKLLQLDAPKNARTDDVIENN